MATKRASLRRLVGERLRTLRLQRGVTSQEKLAEMAGMHRTYIGRLERGESGVTVDTLATVLTALSLSLGEFFRPFRFPVSTRTPRRRD